MLGNQQKIAKFEFSKQMITKKDYATPLLTLRTFSGSKEKIESYMHRVLFVITGYDLDPRELHEIPEVVEYFRELHKRWPHFMHFSTSLLSAWFWFAVINYFTPKAGEPNAYSVVEVTKSSLDKFIKDWYASSNELFALSAMTMETFFNKQQSMLNEITTWVEKYLPHLKFLLVPNLPFNKK